MSVTKGSRPSQIKVEIRSPNAQLRRISLMSDHFSGPRALADPTADISDVFAFPAPETPHHLVIVMDVFGKAGPSAVFSDAVIYRFRIRPVDIAATGRRRHSHQAGASSYSTSRSSFRAAGPIRGDHSSRAAVSRRAEARFRFASTTKMVAWLKASRCSRASALSLSFSTCG
jgi:hypothetical protein